MSEHQAPERLKKNRLLGRLPESEFAALHPHLELVQLAHGDHTIVPDEPIRHAYFPISCLLSMVTTMQDGATVESGSIGREGMSGIPIILDAGTTPMPTFAQIPGAAVRLSAEVLKDMFERGGALQKLLHRYMHTVIVTASQTAACHRLHKVEQRLCHWLLMSSDGVASNDLPLTQEFLAMMLGTRRPGVSEAAGMLQAHGLISYSRGHIQILDRPRLEQTACECYPATKTEFDRLLG